MRKLILLFAITSTLQGCYTYGGPYVTKVEGDPKGLSVEKCRIKFNPWTGQFAQDQCVTETVKPGK
jgi:hypothetical protein